MVTIYVIKLQYNKYYVGKTTNPTYRLTDHFSENGSAWTNKYKPISVIELRPNRPDTDEQVVTQEYMEKYGIDNVRGGPWCKVSLTELEKQMINQIIKSNSDVCYKCDKKGHFSENCKYKKKNIYDKPKQIICERCGRTNHKSDNCYAKTDINMNYLSDTDDSCDIWGCSYCNKEFDSEKGANYHEQFYCKNKNKNKNKNKSNTCKRCGRTGHYNLDCYASTHTRGYDLYY